jgi:hypothetical protein
VGNDNKATTIQRYLFSLSLSLSLSSYFFYFHYYTEAQTHFAVERAVLNGERPPIPPGLPRTIEEIITTCWTTKPEKRPEFNELFDILKDTDVRNDFNLLAAYKFDSWTSKYKKLIE